ncbi:hypothetical protein [Sinorhizobium meliloti]|nr:hypothetical protein [Sinorhizobium meliloti]
MNNTKWDELRVAMEALDRPPLWALQGMRRPRPIDFLVAAI